MHEEVTITLEAETGSPIVDRSTAEATKNLADAVTVIFHSRPMDVTEHKLHAVRAHRAAFLASLPSDLRQQALYANDFQASRLAHKYGAWASTLPFLYAYSGTLLSADTPVKFGVAVQEAYDVAREVDRLLLSM